MQKERLSLGAVDQQHKCQEEDLACQLSEHREQMCLKGLQDGEEHQPGNQLYNFKPPPPLGFNDLERIFDNGVDSHCLF